MKTSQPGGGSVTSYVYDADGRRVKKTTGSASTYFIYDAFGELAAEYVSTDPTGSAETHYLTTDHLGSTRLVTNQTGAVVSRHDYLPFGWELYSGLTGRTNGHGYLTSPEGVHTPTQRFTGKERDTETGLDYFGARYLAGVLGRFTGADPIMLMDQKLLDPQQWNMYSYVRNNPLRLIDPTGMYVCNGSQDQCKDFEKQRQEALKSKNADVRAGASSYGDVSKDNGVTVRFGDPGKGKAGTATASLGIDPNDPSKFRANVDVLIKTGQSGVSLRDTIVHEGIHVRDAQGFAATATMDGQYDLSKNLTSWQTEMNAYAASAAVMAEAGRTAQMGVCGRGPCSFGPGMSTGQVGATSMILLANPANGYNRFIDAGGGTFVNQLGMRQFPAITTPAPPLPRP